MFKEAVLTAQHSVDRFSIRDCYSFIPSEVELHGEAGIRNRSELFDYRNPHNHLHFDSESEACIAELTSREVAVIAFAQERIRRIAEALKSTLQDLEIETIPVVTRNQALPTGCAAGFTGDLSVSMAIGAITHQRVPKSTTAKLGETCALPCARVGFLDHKIKAGFHVCRFDRQVH